MTRDRALELYSILQDLVIEVQHTSKIPVSSDVMELAERLEIYGKGLDKPALRAV